MQQLDNDTDIFDLALYRDIFPQADRLLVEERDHAGFSGAYLKTLQFYHGEEWCGQLMAKQVVLNEDWLSVRSGDRVGREALCITLLNNEVVQGPYIYLQQSTNSYVLIMHDVSDDLLPDNREPLMVAEELSILKSLARMHAYYWQKNEVADASFLMSLTDLCDLMSPRAQELMPAPSGIGDWMTEGWAHAQSQLSDELWSLMSCPAASITAAFKDLPCTLIHGDAKLANMYWTSYADLRGVGFFDWAFAAYAPATAELGWYLAVNASRLAVDKYTCIQLYRQSLIEALSLSFNDSEWEHMLDCAILVGARMLLWTKARNLKNQVSGAESEWNWWLAGLERIKMNIGD